MRSWPGLAFALMIASRNDPGPESALVVTLNVIALETEEINNKHAAEKNNKKWLTFMVLVVL